MIDLTDTSLLEEWESLLHPELRLEAREARGGQGGPLAGGAARQPKSFAARVRAEMHLLVRALAVRDWEEAVASVQPDPDAPGGPWDETRFEEAMAPFFAEYGELIFTPEARRHQWTEIRPTASAPGTSSRPSSTPRATTSGRSREPSTCASRRRPTGRSSD